MSNQLDVTFKVGNHIEKTDYFIYLMHDEDLLSKLGDFMYSNRCYCYNIGKRRYTWSNHYEGDHYNCVMFTDNSFKNVWEMANGDIYIGLATEKLKDLYSFILEKKYKLLLEFAKNINVGKKGTCVFLMTKEAYEFSDTDNAILINK